VVLVTSIETREMPSDALDMIAGEGGRFWRVRTPKLSLSVNGAGDAIAALFFVHYARSQSAEIALKEASASIFGLLKRTAEAGSREILTVAAQDEFVSPTHRFPAEEI
jgi:pyridoxine kinase